jgi:hypothetical protein
VVGAVYFVGLGEGFVGQISKVVRGTKPLLAGIERHRE